MQLPDTLLELNKRINILRIIIELQSSFPPDTVELSKINTVKK